MKKLILILGIFLTTIFLVPTDVWAVDFNDNDGDGVYVSDEAISMGQYGTVAAGDYTWTYTDEDAGIKTWSITFDVSNTNGYIYFLLVPNSVSIDSVSVNSTSSSYLVADTQTAEAGTYVLLEPSGVSSASSSITISVVTTDTADTGCMLNVSPLSLDCSVDIPGYYFDDNGNSITEAEYQSVCSNVSDPNDIPNSETGSVVPYIAILGGLVVIGVIYLFSRKANKVYKI